MSMDMCQLVQVKTEAEDEEAFQTDCETAMDTSQWTTEPSAETESDPTATLFRVLQNEETIMQVVPVKEEPADLDDEIAGVSQVVENTVFGQNTHSTVLQALFEHEPYPVTMVRKVNAGRGQKGGRGKSPDSLPVTRVRKAGCAVRGKRRGQGRGRGKSQEDHFVRMVNKRAGAAEDDRSVNSLRGHGRGHQQGGNRRDYITVGSITKIRKFLRKKQKAGSWLALQSSLSEGQEPCLVCSAPSPVSKSRKFEKKTFCQKCKKSYIYKKSSASYLRKERTCSKSGNCLIHYQQPLLWCHACHMNKFIKALAQTSLSSPDLKVEIDGEDQGLKSLKTGVALSSQEFEAWTRKPYIALKRMSEKDLAEYGMAIKPNINTKPMDQDIKFEPSVIQNLIHGGASFRDISSPGPVIRFDSDSNLSTPARIKHMEAARWSDGNELEPSYHNSYNQTAPNEKKIQKIEKKAGENHGKQNQGQDFIQSQRDCKNSLTVYVFTCGHACSACNSDPARQWLRESGYNMAPPVSVPPSHLTQGSDSDSETASPSNDSPPETKPKPKKGRGHHSSKHLPSTSTTMKTVSRNKEHKNNQQDRKSVLSSGNSRSLLSMEKVSVILDKLKTIQNSPLISNTPSEDISFDKDSIKSSDITTNQTPKLISLLSAPCMSEIDCETPDRLKLETADEGSGDQRDERETATISTPILDSTRSPPSAISTDEVVKNIPSTARAGAPTDTPPNRDPTIIDNNVSPLSSAGSGSHCILIDDPNGAIKKKAVVAGHNIRRKLYRCKSRVVIINKTLQESLKQKLQTKSPSPSPPASQ